MLIFINCTYTHTVCHLLIFPAIYIIITVIGWKIESALLVNNHGDLPHLQTNIISVSVISVRFEC